MSDSDTTKCIAKTRYKPVMRFDKAFSFNGHPDFHTNGKTDNPKIGTTEDWVFFSFFVNHPIHIHLINYQVISTTPLKKCINCTDGCYFSEIDYYIQAGVVKICNTTSKNGCYKEDEYDQICTFIKKSNQSTWATTINDKNVFPEDAEG